MKMIQTLAAICAVNAMATGQALAAPHAEGHVRLDPQTGFVQGEICLTDRPEAAGTHFTLNAGLNIAHIRSGPNEPSLDYEGFFNGEIYGDGRLYSVDLPAEAPVCVEYVGAAPIYDQRDAFLDWKGRMATDGRIFRLTEQTAWLPLPIDPETKQIFNQITYSIEVSCETCDTLYISGSEPAPAPDAVFETDIPAQPILLAGRYSATNLGPLWALNSEITPAQAESLASGFQQIAAVQADYLGIAYGQAPVFVEFDNLDFVRRPNRGWGFVSWPTIAFGGVQTLGLLADAFDNPDAADSQGLIGYVAHEAGHFYFGTHHRPSGAFAPFFLESTAEYLSLVTLEAMLGEEARTARTAQLAEGLFTFEGELPRLHQITATPDERLSIWRYVYGPLVLQSMHDVIGEAQARAFVSAMAAAETTPDDWAAMTALAMEAGVTEAEWARWIALCLEPELADGCLTRYRSSSE